MKKRAGSDAVAVIAVEKTIISGQTNKAKVIQEFGSPNMVNADSDGTEQWVYDYTRYESSGTDFGALGAAYIPGLVMVDGGMSKDVSSHKSTTLSIYFDINGIVDRYHYSTKTM